MKKKILVVDDERLSLSHTTRLLERVVPGGDVRGFSLPRAALEEIVTQEFRPGVAVLDIEMPGMTGLELAKKIREISPVTKIIFLTGFSHYALDAYSVHARGYLMKPVTEDKLREELEELKELEEKQPAPTSRVQVRCFGNFEVFVDERSLLFSRSKAKELLAYLIHKRGTACTVRELAAILFEDKEYSIQVQNYLQKIISSMMKALDEVGVDHIVSKQHNSLAVNISEVDCDFYRFFRLEPAAVNSYMGEYMAQYSWAEFTLGYLDQIVR